MQMGPSTVRPLKTILSPTLCPKLHFPFTLFTVTSTTDILIHRHLCLTRPYFSFIFSYSILAKTFHFSGSAQRDFLSSPTSFTRIPFFTLRARKLGIFSSLPLVEMPFLSRAFRMSFNVLFFGGLKYPS